ncbi:hypothetical protein QE152_g9516 [Popillia japonica]|uniref:Uncharacterized protein n=1 Tax=Popillia japonica TaxID=7064 RepID=A0AAW1LY66_POPJA
MDVPRESVLLPKDPQPPRIRQTMGVEAQVHKVGRVNAKYVEQITCTSKVLILADSLGRDAAMILKNYLGSTFSVQSIIEPNADFNEVVCDVEHLCREFVSQDCVIILAGTHNVLKRTPVLDNTYNVLARLSKQVKLIYVTIAFWINNSKLNNLIYDFNLNMFDTLCKNGSSGGNFVETNAIIDMNNDKVKHGPHLKII